MLLLCSLRMCNFISVLLFVYTIMGIAYENSNCDIRTSIYDSPERGISSRSSKNNYIAPLPKVFPGKMSGRYCKVKNNNHTRDIMLKQLGLATKAIPRLMWVSFKSIPSDESEISEKLKVMISSSQADGWSVHFFGHDDQMRFLEEYYPATRLLWAAKMIHPLVGVSVSDIWRLAVLYAFGGFYIDDDSLIVGRVEEIVQPNDQLILSYEKNPFSHNCYRPDYRLSSKGIQKINNAVNFKSIYGGRTIINWAMFSRPGHPIIRTILENIVEVISLEYTREHPIYLLRFEPRYKRVFCATGPAIITSTIHHLAAVNSSATFPMVRMTVRPDFVDYGGEFKDGEGKHVKRRESTHYWRVMNKYNVPLLRLYAPLNVTKLEGKPVNDGSLNQLFLIQNATRRRFPTLDTFMAMNFSSIYTVTTVHNLTELQSIPAGADLPALDFTGSYDS